MSSEPTKKKKTKSRNGCLTCKRRRLKCDETKPFCNECTRRKIPCEGYVTNFKWRSFEEVTAISQARRTSADPAVSGQKRSYSQISVSPAVSPTPSTAASSIDALIQAAIRTAPGSVAPSPAADKSASTSATPGTNPTPKTADGDEFGYENAASPNLMAPSPTNILAQFSPNFSFFSADDAYPSIPTPKDYLSLNSPQSAVSALKDLNYSLDKCAAGYEDADNDCMRLMTQASGSDQSPFGGGPPVIYDYLTLLNRRRGANSPESSTSSDTSMRGLWRNNGLAKPLSIPDSLFTPHDQIFELYDRHTCGILSIKDGPTENPWRTVVWPLAQNYGALYHAVAAMTLFHTSKARPMLRAQAAQHMRESFNILANGLSNKSLPENVALATTIALAMAEVWDRHICSGIAHIRGASTLLRRLIAEQDQSKPLPPWLQFLFNSWLYLDVLARLTSESGEDLVIEDSGGEDNDEEEEEEDKDQDKSTDKGKEHEQTEKTEESAETEAEPETKTKAETETKSEAGIQMTPSDNLIRSRIIKHEPDLEDDRRSNADLFGSPSSVQESPKAPLKRRKSSGASSKVNLKSNLFMSMKEQVDPLLGCGQTLFPLIGKVGSLVHSLRKLKKNTLMIISAAAELKKQLDMWKPAVTKDMMKVEDPSWDINSCVATAEAYRYSALLYLHQAVPELPSLTTRQLADKVLMLLAMVPASSGTCIVHIFPLLVAGCEAESKDSREWVRERWKLLSRRMWIGNVDKAMEVVREVWARKDVTLRQRRDSREGAAPLVASLDQVSTPTAIAQSIAAHVAQSLGESDQGPVGQESVDTGVRDWCHWTVVMKEWGWELMLG